MKVSESIHKKVQEAQRQEILKHKGLSFEIWFEPRKGYFVKGKGEIKKVISKDFFKTSDEAVEHAEESIESYLED